MKIKIENAKILEITEDRLTADFWKKNIIIQSNGKSYLIEFFSTLFPLLDGINKKDFVDVEFEIVTGEWEVKKWVKKSFTFLKGTNISKNKRSGASKKEKGNSRWETSFNFDVETDEILNKIIAGSIEKHNKRISQQDAIRLAIETFSNNNALFSKSIENLNKQNVSVNSIEPSEKKLTYFIGQNQHIIFIKKFQKEAESKAKIRLRNYQVIKILAKDYFSFMYE